MLARLTAKNQLMLPKAITEAVGPTEYFEVQAIDGRIVLTPVRIQRGDAVRAKLAEFKLGEADMDAAVDRARRHPMTNPRAALDIGARLGSPCHVQPGTRWDDLLDASGPERLDT